VAASVNQAPLIVEVLCEGAWSRFEAADLSGYAAEIARTIEQAARPGDVILLAQTSMAPAVELVRHLGIPVLSSPRSGVEAAMSMYRTATPSRQPQ
jgi:acyl-CoA synthetase (NDP forming)